MRRSVLLLAVLGLAWVLGAVPAGAQTSTTITLSFADTSGNALTAVGEGSGTGTVRVVATAGAAVSSNVSVTVSVGASGGTAGRSTLGCTGTPLVCDGDYTTAVTSVTVTIASGHTSGSADITFLTLDDRVAEDPETIRFTGTATGYTVTQADLTITDANSTVFLTPSATVLSEGGGGSGVSVSAAFGSSDGTAATSSTRGSAADVTLLVSTVSGDTAAAADFSYAPSTPNAVSIPANAVSSSVSGTLAGLSVTDDDVVEGPETLTLRGSHPSLTTETVSLTIADDDADIALSVEPGVVAESASAQTITVTASFAGTSTVLTSATDVTVTVAGGGGADGATLGASGDFTTDQTSNQFTVRIPAGSLSGSATFGLTARADGASEVFEKVALSGSASVGGSSVTVTSAELNIADGIIALSFADASRNALTAVGEDGGAQTVRVVATANSAVSSNVSVTVSVGASGGTAVRASTCSGSPPVCDGDYSTSASSVTVTIPSGSTSGSPAMTVTTHGDTVAEDPETIRFTGTATGYWVTQADLTITDMDSNVFLTPSANLLSEGGGGSGVTVSADFRSDGGTAATSSTRGSAADVTLLVSAVSGDTAAAADFSYAPSPPNAVSIPANAVSSSVSGTLAGLSVTDDDVVEGPETLTLRGSHPSLTTETVSLTIADDDADIALSVSPGVVAESASAQTITVTASFAGTSTVLTSATDVTVTVAGGGGADGATLGASGDFTTDQTSNQFTVTIPAGSLSGSATFGLTARADGASEGIEKVALSGSASVGGSSVTVTGAELSIADGIVTLSLADASDNALTAVGEDGGAQTVRVVATAGAAVSSNVSVTVSVGASGGTATSGSCSGSPPVCTGDYGASGSSVAVSIASGSTSGSADVTVTPYDDTVAEGPETIRFTGSASGYTVLEADLAITDADSTVFLTPSATVSEGTGGSGVSVSAAFKSSGGTAATSSAHGSATDITLLVSGDTAGAADFSYAPSTPNTVSIPANAVSSSVSGTLAGLSVTDDDVVEGPETLTLSGSHPSFTAESVSLTVADDDADIALSVSPGVVAESASAQTITVTASFAGTSTVLTSATDVTVTVAGGGGADGATLGASGDFTTDQTSNQFTVTIPAGSLSGSATFGLTARADSTSEGIEKVALSGSATVGGSSVTVTGAELSITDGFVTLTVDDGATPPNPVASLGEGSGTSQLNLNVSLPAGFTAPAGGADVRFRVVAGTATADADTSFDPDEDFRVTYMGSVDLTDAYPGSVQIAANAASGTAAFSLVINDDNRFEGSTPETILVQGGTVTISGSLLHVMPISLEITDNDSPPYVPPPRISTGDGGGPTKPAYEGRFSDDDGNSHEANIDAIFGWGITMGCRADEPRLFCPSQPVLRRQMAVFLYRAVTRLSGAAPPAVEGVELSDVPGDASYASYAQWAVAAGVVAAPGGEFNPGAAATRADIAVGMIAAFPHLAPAQGQPRGLFEDMQGQDPAVVLAAEALYEAAVTRGCTAVPLRYCPDQPVSRAQMATLIVRALSIDPAFSG